jgi:NADH-quinone oxidoreductase subunit A
MFFIFYFFKDYNYIIFYNEYFKILITAFFVFILCSILILIPYIFSISIIKDQQKLSEYECGFEPFDNSTRLPFDVHFYLVGILFLIFDIEIVIIFP